MKRIPYSIDRKVKYIVVVVGHAVVRLGATGPRGVKNEKNWIGGFSGESPYYFQHIKLGVEFVADHPDTCLIFSGGVTRAAAGERSEARGYFEVARDHDFFGHTKMARRCFLEEFARDSFENLAFSLALFFQLSGRWPLSVTVVGWEFKSERFHLHRQALKWPDERFRYMGVNNPPKNALATAIEGEKAKVASVKNDLFLAGPQWASQRELRDPFGRCHPYRGVDAGLDALFELMARNSPRSRFGWI